MTTGFSVGDVLRVTGNHRITHAYNIGDIVKIFDFDNEDPHRPRVRGSSGFGPPQTIHIEELELIEEESMAEKRSNPKNFRNGDVIKVTTRTDQDSMVFVKFGENYYNLTAGGQMKACRYLPPGTKEIITNLSGMGKFFLMSEEELEEQAGRPSGGSTTSTNPVTDFEHIMKMADSIQWDNTTEEK